MIALPIFDPFLHWTRKMVDGLDKLGEFVSLEAEDLMSSGCTNQDAVATMKAGNMVHKRYVKPLRRKIADETNEHSERRKNIDRIRCKNLPDVALQNSAARLAMYDVEVIHAAYFEQYKATGKIPSLVRRALNAKCYGVAAYRTFPGRPGEWERMTAKQIKECIDDPDAWFVIITDHKTKKQFPELGRYMPKDVKAVFARLLDFSDPKKNLLFQPQRPNTKNCQMSKLAIDFALADTPGRQSAEPTLLRKHVETATKNKENKKQAAEMVRRTQEFADGCDPAAAAYAAKMSGHEGKTQKKFYDLNSADPTEHATASWAYIESFVGPVLQPHSAEEKAALAKRTAEVILEEFRLATTRTKEGNDEDSDSEAEGSECESHGDGADDDVQMKSAASASNTGSVDDDAPVLSLVSPAVTSKRKFTYDKEKGQFTKIDPNPNLLVPNVRPQKKPRTSDVEPPEAATFRTFYTAPLPQSSSSTCLLTKAQGRPQKLDEGNIEFIVAERNAINGHEESVAPPNALLRLIVAEGKEHQKLPEWITLEQVRNVCRNY